MEKLSLEEIHQTLLEIVSHIHDILSDARIPYYMIGGTLLGAVRHKGFIPWDDDMDLGIMRADFEKAIAVLKEKLPRRYQIRNTLNCKGIVGEIFKVEDTTTFIEEFKKDSQETNIGINVDLFPLDKANNTNYSLFSRNRFLHILSRIDKARLLPDNKKTKAASPFLRVLFFPAKRDFFVRVKRHIYPKKGDLITNYSGSWGMREFVPKEYFGDPKPYKFENLTLFGVSKSHEYLTNIYGDYMTPPPKEKRHLHICDAYRR